MQDDAGSFLPLPHRHFYSSHHHVPILAMMHGPANDQLTVHIQHDAQIKFALLDLNFFDISDPFGIWL